MKFRNNALKFVLSLATTSLIGLTPVSFASEMPDYSNDKFVSPLNANTDIYINPIVKKQGVVDKSEQIANLEDAILNSTITANAAKFLLENSPETVRPIRKALQKQLKDSNALLKEAEALLKELKPNDKKEDKNLKKLKDAYVNNLVMVDSARMLLENTPQTVKKVENKLKKQIQNSEGLLKEVEQIIYETEMKDFYRVKPLNRKITGLIFDTPSEAAILNYWRSYESQSENLRYFDGIYLVDPYTNLYEVQPDLANDNPGMLKLSVQNDINHITNTARYSVGLPTVGINQEYSYYAQASSVINSLNNVLTHWPRAPKGYANDNPLYQDGYYGSESSNISQGYNALRQAYAFIMDDDEENWNEVGHRANLLNPTSSYYG